MTPSGIHAKPTVLLAEYQALISMWLEDVLSEAGYSVEGPYGTCEAALVALQHHRPDYAVVSVDLTQGPCFALACALRRADIPFMLFSGSVPVLQAFQDVPVLARPCRDHEFVASLPRALRAQQVHRQHVLHCPRVDLLGLPPTFALDQCPPACGG